MLSALTDAISSDFKAQMIKFALSSWIVSVPYEKRKLLLLDQVSTKALLTFHRLQITSTAS